MLTRYRWLLNRIRVKFNRIVGTQFKARDHPPARVVGLRIVQPEVRAPAFGAAKRRRREDAPEQSEIAHGERALEFMAARLVGRPRLIVEAHHRHVLALDALVLRERLLECLFVADRAKVLVRQHAARRAHVGLQRDRRSRLHQVCEPRALGFWNRIVSKRRQIDSCLLDERCRPPAGAATVDERTRQRRTADAVAAVNAARRLARCEQTVNRSLAVDVDLETAEPGVAARGHLQRHLGDVDAVVQTGLVDVRDHFLDDVE